MQEAGGSLEDLWPFNEEIVARAIYDSGLPIISAVGHETDFTIADFVADLRAPTPSAAAELAVPNISDIVLKLESYNNRYKLALKKKVEFMKLRYETCMNSRVFKEPTQKINEKYMLIDMKVKSMQNSISKIYNEKKTNMVKHIAKLDALSPLKTLTRGYTIAELNGHVIKSVSQVKKDDNINLRLSDGSINAKVL